MVTKPTKVYLSTIAIALAEIAVAPRKLRTLNDTFNRIQELVGRASLPEPQGFGLSPSEAVQVQELHQGFLNQFQFASENLQSST